MKVGQRLIITERWGRTLIEVEVLEISPSGEYVKLKDASGHGYWEEAGDIQVREVLEEAKISDILLTEEEIAVVVKAWVDVDYGVQAVSLNRGHWEDVAPVIAQAQLLRVAVWSDEPCPHGTLAADTSRASRRECEQCWQELRKAGIGGEGCQR